MRLAILEDDPDQLALLRRWITDDGHDVHAYVSGREAMKMAGRESFDLFIGGHDLGDHGLGLRGVLFGHVIDCPQGLTSLKRFRRYEDNLTVRHKRDIGPSTRSQQEVRISVVQAIGACRTYHPRL